VGAWSPSPEDTATGAAPHQRAQLGLGGESGWVAHLNQQVHGSDGGDAVLVGERGAEPAQQGQDLLVELGDPGIQASDVSGRLGQPGEVDPVGRSELDRAGQALLQRTEPRADPAGLGQRRPHGERQAGQDRLGLIQQPDPLTDQALAPVANGDQLLPGRVGAALLARRRQVRVSQCLPGDRLGVLPVGLVPPPPAATLGSAVGLDLAHVIAGRDQGLGDVPAKSG
jgi:hypothetical protein